VSQIVVEEPPQQVGTQIKEASRSESEPVKNVTGITAEGNNAEIEETSQVHYSTGKNTMSVLEKSSFSLKFQKLAGASKCIKKGKTIASMYCEPIRKDT
jgi:hypothetical protein